MPSRRVAFATPCARAIVRVLQCVAPGGGVLVDDALATSLATLSGFETTALRRRTLRGIGQVTPSELRRAAGGRKAPSAPSPARSSPREAQP